MTWLIAVLLSTMFFAWVSVLDKKLVTDLFTEVRDFYLVFGLMQLVIGPVFIVVAWANGGFGGVEGIAWSAATGVAFFFGLMLFFYGLSRVEVSRAAPVQMLAPLVATLIAVIFQGETLTLVQGSSVPVVVTGAVLVSLRFDGGSLRIARGLPFVVLLASAFVIGVAFAVTAQASGVASVWAVQGVSTLLLGVLVIAVVGRRERILRVPGMLRDRRVAGVMLLTEGLLAPAAVFTLILAFSLGSVSVVSVVAASRPLLVLVISVALSTHAWNVLHEPLDRETLGLKAFATMLIVGGVAALAIEGH